MRIAANVVGVVLLMIGVVWFLQGINVLPGSFMTGQTKWAVYGGIAVAVGGALLAKWGGRRPSLNTVAAIVLLMGTTWILQGVNILPGSFMTGQMRWAVYGGIADLIGVGVLLLANRRAAA
jgi:hypothetical protein